MNLVLLADEDRKNEFLSIDPAPGCSIQWFDHLPVEQSGLQADLLIDFLFDNSAERISWLQQPSFTVVMVNWLEDNLPAKMIRINGWPGFTGRKIIEATCSNEQTRQAAIEQVAMSGRTIEWIPSGTPFISQAIISSIINEAFLTFEEGTASQEGIDTAMKLGTNYPFGPFEWAGRIGYRNIVSYLEYNNRENPLAAISILLKEKALAQ